MAEEYEVSEDIRTTGIQRTLAAGTFHLSHSKIIESIAMRLKLFFISLFGALPEITLGQAAETADLCCAALNSSAISDRIAFPDTAVYEDSVHSYFGVNAQLEPTCIVQPRSAEDVSIAVKTLTKPDAGPCLFAVRSGGHTTSVGAANISPGVTIDLSLMNATTYDAEKGTAYIQPGSRWAGVFETLLPLNVTVPGGRTAPVGVGGFLTGGGNSFYAARVGLSCDNIQSYEIVLASGDIITVNHTSHADLFKALKGGSSNFGIVTRFELKAYPSDGMWGGIVIYNSSVTDEYIEAASKFIDNIPNDPYASWIGMFGYNSTTDEITIFTPLDYTAPVERPDAFKDFYTIPEISNTLRFSNILELTTENSQAEGYRNVLQTGTYLSRKDVLHKIVEILNRKVEQAKSRARGTDFAPIVIVQPWIPLFWKDSEARGGNVLGLERFDQNMINVLWDFSWDSAADDDLFYELAESARDEIDEYTKSTKTYTDYIYLNYADGTQNPLRGYGSENMAYIAQVANKYDPDGVFQTLVPGGFKISKA
ncbi:FAD-binding oxidoreductase [Aspergillus lucknowensis]|uniref:FAD-binding PCMH-type domain-containing protein n=1 Tax=Aspergillus lucknowensis TaxID=176173 RepID=A0ABR4LGL9_9EURO